MVEKMDQRDEQYILASTKEILVQMSSLKRWLECASYFD